MVQLVVSQNKQSTMLAATTTGPLLINYYNHCYPKDMIETTGYDFKVVNIVSIAAIFIIIALVEKSVTLPFILISVIELAIFINLGIPHYLGQSLPFIAPICISTIQLGATVDYAILMTTRYKTERIRGAGRKASVATALTSSIPSIAARHARFRAWRWARSATCATAAARSSRA